MPEPRVTVMLHLVVPRYVWAAIVIVCGAVAVAVLHIADWLTASPPPLP